MMVLASIAAMLAVFGLCQTLAGYVLVRRFRKSPLGAAEILPPVTVLKPLFGAEPLLEEALATLCCQEYGPYQIVFGVHDEGDPALAVVRRVQARFPASDIAVVVNPAQHGRNGKVSNLINMMVEARHDVLVIADSDVHCAPDYLHRLVAALQQDGTGLVTTLYAGLAASPGLAGALGATAITHGFLPGALMARALGRQDCLGATMALRRGTLQAIGGFQAVADEIADDAVLGRRVRALGLAVGLADTVPVTTVPETWLTPLFAHERRWGRTILSLAPGQFALSSVQYPLAWALLALGLSGGSEWAWAVLLAGWSLRALVGRAIDRSLGLARSGLATPTPVWLLPLRDVMSVGVLLASYASDEVRWRGELLTVPVVPPHMGAISTLPQGTKN